MPSRLGIAAIPVILAFSSMPVSAVAEGGFKPKVAPPAVGDKAVAFTLKSLGGEDVTLSEAYAQGPVVLLVLRGYPGYQCPLCTRQVADFLANADEFKAKNAKVLMVYPGPAANLKKYAQEFVKGKKLPENYELLVDPDYEFTKAYGLRWDAPQETAYPSTFVIDQNGMVRFAKISRSHGDRTKASAIVKAISSL